VELLVGEQLALLCTGQQRFQEGEQAIRQALKLGLSDAKLLAELGETLRAAGKWATAEMCLRRSIGIQAAAKAYVLLGDVLDEQRQLGDALESYEKALECGDVEADGRALHRYIMDKVRTLRETLGIGGGVYNYKEVP